MALTLKDSLKKSTKPTFLFVSADDIYFLSHRLPAAKAAQNAGFEVIVMAADTGVSGKIHEMGFCFIPVQNGRNKKGLFNMDLIGIATLQLMENNIKHISYSNLCTVKNNIDFYSHRYSSDVERFGTFVWFE